MRIASGLALGVAFAAVVACASQRAVMPIASAPPSEAAVLPAPHGAQHDEITRLDREIEQQLAQLGLPTSQPPPCAADGCARPTAEQMSTANALPSSDATCKPAPSEPCQTSCTFANSICSNAKRICELADELGGDAYANEKCARGTESCQRSREKCCGCL
jgi:hypothetical protein